MNHKTILAPIIVLALGSLALSCSDSESRMPFADAATAVINLAHSDAPDRALSVDAPRRGAGAGVPIAQFDRVNLKITGPDIATIERNMPFSNTISIDVPSGPLRRFEVTVYVGPYDPDNLLTWTAAYSFRGVTSVNLPAGTSVSIPVLMSLHETKIVVPDRLNNRIVQFDNPANASETWFTSEGILYPTEIDFDARGRILFVNNPGGANNIYRMESIFGMGQPCLLSDETNDIVSIAVDRKRNLLYYATDDHAGTVALKRVNLLMIPESAVWYMDIPETPVFTAITALDVADDGSLYIAGVDDNPYSFLAKYNPLVENGVLVGQHFTNNEFFSPLDVMVRGNSICVLNDAGGNDGFVLLDFNFGPSAAIGGLGFTLGPHFGSLINDPPSEGFFYGPRKFAARREDTLVIIDEGGYFDGNPHSIDRLVFTDFSPLKPWRTFGSMGSGNSEFRFYAYC